MAFLGVLPLKKIEDIQNDNIFNKVPSKIAKLVTQIRAIKRSNPAADTSKPEAEIVALVHELFRPSKEEKKLIEVQ